LIAILATVAVVVVVVGATWTARTLDGDPRPHPGAAAPRRPPTTRTTSPATTRVRPPEQYHCPCPNLVAGSNPAALPGAVLIADHLNNRLLIVEPNGRVAWEFPRPGDLAPGQTFLVPDDAFFTPDGREIVVTEEDDFVISLISVAEHRIVWRYGTPGQPGSDPNQLWNPDDAMMMPDGNIILADIKNCRLLILRPGLGRPLHVYGVTGTGCWHGPPQHWGSPNGAFPMRDGSYLVTEINGDWVDGLTLSGQITFSVHPPGVAYPSDSNEVRPSVYLTADYSQPGQIEEFNQAGSLMWRYAPVGAAAMDRPSLALPLPNGSILCNDDFNHRVIVINPHTNAIVWQYGHTRTPGSAPGYLDDPDGVDPVPPFSLTIANRATMGSYPIPSGASPTARP
jgi:hypothetical protein